MKRTFVVGLALAALVVGGWIAWRSGRTSSPSGGPDGSANDGAARERPAAPSPAIAAATSDADRRDAPAESGTPAARAATGRSVRVQVVDESGQPVIGADVLLAVRREGSAHADRCVPTAPPDGIAVLPLREHLERAGAPFVRLGAPLSDPEEVPIDPKSPPADVIRLAMPPTGRIVVRVEDPEGRPLLEEATATLNAEPRGDRASWVMRADSADRPRSKTGELVFPHVELGLRWVAGVSVEGRRYETEARGAGPTSPGEEATLRATVKLHPFISGRVLSAEGLPLASASLDGTLTVEDRDASVQGPVQSVGFVTDPEGRFHLEIVERLPSNGTRTLVLRPLERPTTRPRARAAVDEAIVDLTRPLDPGETPIGDVRLGKSPLLVSGVVLDDANRPVAGALVRVERERLGSSNGTSEESDWESLSFGDDMFRTDELGRFELRAGFASGRYRASVAETSSAFPGRPHVFVPPAESVELRLHAAGGISGSVLRGDDLPADDVRVMAVIQGLETWPERSRAVNAGDRPKASGEFTLAPLRPDRFDVTVYVRDERVVHVADVEVRSSETSRDARLQAIDLRHLKSFTISVVDRDGTPIDGASVRCISAGASAESLGRTMRSGARGRVRVLATGPSDLVVGAAGYRPVTVRGVASDTTVTVSRGVPVRVVLTNAAELPGPPLAARLELVHIEAYDQSRRDGANLHPGARAFGEVNRGTGAATFTVGMPGRHRVHLYVLGPIESETLASTSVEASPRFLEVAESDREQTFDVTIAEGAIAKGLERLERMRAPKPAPR